MLSKSTENPAAAATDYDDDDGCMSATHRCYPGAQDTPLSSRSHTLFNRLEQ